MLRDPDDRWVRAVDVDAPAELVWRWLCQLRVAPYSYDLLDNGGRRSPQELTPGLDALEPGQRMMSIFRLASFAPSEHVTLVGRPRAPLPLTVLTYAVRELDAGRSRLTMHALLRLPRVARNPAGRAGLALLRVGDLVMARRQLLNLRALAERDARR